MILIAIVISLILSGIYILTNRTPEIFMFGKELMDFLYGISLATIAASIFYFFQIFIPEKRRQAIIKKNFKLNYIIFKQRCISIFLSTIGLSCDFDLTERLSEMEEFKKYFKQNFAANQDRWDGLINNFDKDKFDDLLIQFEIFSQQIDLFIDNVSLQDKNVFTFLKRLKITIHSLKNTNLSEDEAKILWHFIWELFTGWGFTSGYRKNDILKEMIDMV